MPCGCGSVNSRVRRRASSSLAGMASAASSGFTPARIISNRGEYPYRPVMTFIPGGGNFKARAEQGAGRASLGDLLRVQHRLQSGGVESAGKCEVGIRPEAVRGSTTAGRNSPSWKASA